jgi:hypothetical protein
MEYQFKSMPISAKSTHKPAATEQVFPTNSAPALRRKVSHAHAQLRLAAHGRLESENESHLPVPGRPTSGTASPKPPIPHAEWRWLFRLHVLLEWSSKSQCSIGSHASWALSPGERTCVFLSHTSTSAHTHVTLTNTSCKWDVK